MVYLGMKLVLGNMEMDENVEQVTVVGTEDIKRALISVPQEQLDEMLSELGYTRGAFWKYLESEQGNDIANRCLSIFESLQKIITEKNHTSGKHELHIKLAAVIAIVSAIITLSLLDKFDPSIGVVLGTIIGYLFSKKAKDI